MHSTMPIMYVFAGNNGSGKSTIRNLIIDRLGISVNIDPDALARGIDPEYPERRRISAGKEAIRLARNCINFGTDFSIETTLAGGNAIRLIRDAKAKGFEISMFYVGLGDYQLNIELSGTTWGHERSLFLIICMLPLESWSTQKLFVYPEYSFLSMNLKHVYCVQAGCRIMMWAT